jgi:hypothetical protein
MAVFVEKETHFWDALVATPENPKNAIQYYHIFNRFSLGKWFRLINQRGQTLVNRAMIRRMILTLRLKFPACSKAMPAIN